MAKFITKALQAKLEKQTAATFADPERDCSSDIAVKFFTPWANATWWLSEVETIAAEDSCNGLEDQRYFGLCDLGMGSPEYGYILKSQLDEIKGPAGLTVERERYSDYTVKSARTEAGLFNSGRAA